MEGLSENWFFILLLLLCIGAHIFGHGHRHGHGGRGAGHTPEDDTNGKHGRDSSADRR